MQEKLTLIREVIDEVANVTQGAEDFAANETETLSDQPPKKKIVNFRDNVMKARDFFSIFRIFSRFYGESAICNTVKK